MCARVRARLFAPLALRCSCSVTDIIVFCFPLIFKLGAVWTLNKFSFCIYVNSIRAVYLEPKAQDKMGSEKYLPELMAEKDTLDPSFQHSLRLLDQGKCPWLNAGVNTSAA